MKNRVELVADGDGVVVLGEKRSVARFLKRAGLLSQAEEVDLSGVTKFLRAGSNVATIAATAVEQSGMYLKLTAESQQRLRDAGGLMKTKEKGISHIMLGEPGKKSMKWLQADDSASALLQNPAILTGLGGVMVQFAEQSETRELKDLLVRIDEKLDDVLRAQRDELIAKINSAENQIKGAMIQLGLKGSSQVIWDKSQTIPGAIDDVESLALEKLKTLADKVDSKHNTGSLRKLMEKVEGDAALYLSVLARCFQLQNQFSEIELHHVLATDPDTFDTHRQGLSARRENRRRRVLESTISIMERLDVAAGVAENNVLLHARSARDLINSLNATAELVDQFHLPLGIEASHSELSLTPWRKALRDPEKRAIAAKEAGQKGFIGAASLVAAAGALGVANAAKSKFT